MKQNNSDQPKPFSERKVTISQTIRILYRNGIEIDEEEAKTILDFLYLLAKTAAKPETQAENTQHPKRKSNPEIDEFARFKALIGQQKCYSERTIEPLLGHG